jgi:hypothetical protein
MALKATRRIPDTGPMDPVAPKWTSGTPTQEQLNSPQSHATPLHKQDVTEILAVAETLLQDMGTTAIPMDAISIHTEWVTCPSMAQVQ